MPDLAVTEVSELNMAGFGAAPHHALGQRGNVTNYSSSLVSLVHTRLERFGTRRQRTIRMIRLQRALVIGKYLGSYAHDCQVPQKNKWLVACNN